MHIPSTAEPSGVVPPKTSILVLILCWITILAEGYDIGIMGTIVPALMNDPQWRLTPMEIGQLSSAALAGTLIGAYFISPLSDLYGRKKLLIACVILFSVSMLFAAWAPTPEIFALVRAIGGLGLGGVISVAAALTVEYSPPGRRNLNFAIMYSGYPIGAVVAALAGIAFMEEYGWHTIVLIGAAPLLIVPILCYWLPESLEYLVWKGHTAKAERLSERLGVTLPATTNRNAEVKHPIREILLEVFSGKNLRGTICLWSAQFAAILVVSGLGTWLPQIMRSSGYDLGSSLSFFAVFNLAAAIGGVVIGRISDKLGPRKTISGAFVIGAASIFALSLNNPLWVNYILVALSGFGSIAAALVLLGYITNYYAPYARASATGWAVGVGRFGAMTGPILGGYVAGLNVSHLWNFAIFALAAIAAAIAVLATPAGQTESSPEGSTTPKQAFGSRVPAGTTGT
ncbi:MFS transporter [Advenella mimigardefordensis]|uniref:Benzoate transport protein n=1 Tax=Advenella mimigardefordensis (strain DSM 17166 / LMG 22922 / DPN7) TaxID=1247726 RepID=W0PJS4_ADVMD|nr:aromatic acid/H+ symport family MFS transporter [Advenella mimigardefordensis]AHG65228.1 benzoate transport protein [Advenella mimigardefordensis DPN7]